MQVQGAVLEEVASALKVLINNQQFSTGMAMTIRNHIKQHVGAFSELSHCSQAIYLEHAMLLELEPLQQLLDFLWVQLAVRVHLLEPYIKAQRLLGFSVSPASCCSAMNC